MPVSGGGLPEKPHGGIPRGVFALKEPAPDASALEEVRTDFKRHFTEPRWPDEWVVLPDLPATPLGKIDRKALAALAGPGEARA